MIREVAFLGTLVMLGVVTACVGVGQRKYLRHVEWDLGAL